MKSTALFKPSFTMMAVLCLLAGILGVGLIPKPASGASIDIGTPEWIGAVYAGTEDPYFQGTNIVAYDEGDTAKLVARLVNVTGHDISIDYGRLKLGWSAVEEEADSLPLTIAKGEYAIFEWVFLVPDVATASNLILHAYEISVQYDETDTGGDADQKWTAKSPDHPTYPKLVVYSEDQAGCRDWINRWDANNDAYTLWGYAGRRMMTEALYLYNNAEHQYAGGEFAEASKTYAEAVAKQQEAIEEDAKSALTGESAQTLEGTGGTKGTGYLIAGIGILLAGIGILVGGLLWVIRGNRPR